MGVDKKVVGDITVCSLGGEININTSPELRRSLDGIIGQSAKKIVLDLGGVTYIDSSGLATLIEVLRRIKREGGTLHLCRLPDKVRSLFEMTKLTKLFQIYDAEEAACANF